MIAKSKQGSINARIGNAQRVSPSVLRPYVTRNQACSLASCERMLFAVGARTVQAEPLGASKDGLGTHQPKNGEIRESGVSCGYISVALAALIQARRLIWQQAAALGRPKGASHQRSKVVATEIPTATS